MTRLDWPELDQAAHRTLSRQRVSQAIQRGVEAGEARFRRRLLLRTLLASAGVAGLVVLGLVLRGIVHGDPAGPEDGGGAVPTVAGISPASGSPDGGTVVTVTGSGFTDTATVTFGNIAASEIRYVSDEELVAVSPSGTGTVAVVVSTSEGSSSPGSAARFRYVLARPPTVIGVEPDRGSSHGGTRVTITGSGFTDNVTVTFGDKAGTDVEILSAKEVTAITPGGTDTVSVRVTTPGGTSDAGPEAQFTYVVTPSPTVTGLDPASGGTKGGTRVTITGTNFTDDASVAFGDNAATDVTFESPSELKATSPAGEGTVDVTVTNRNGTSVITSEDRFAYVVRPAPTVTSLTPARGSTNGGTRVTITGTRFTEDATVAFGDKGATDLTFISTTQLDVTSPPGTGRVDVTVSTPDGTSTVGSATTFEYVVMRAPTVAGVNPSSGRTSGGEVVTINGTGFTDTATVSFGGRAGTGVTFDSATQLRVTTPASSVAGIVDVSVTTVGGTSVAAPKAVFRYVTPPTVSSLTPDQGSLDGGTTVTIKGTGFVTGAVIRFGGSAAATPKLVSSTELVVKSPAGSGTVDVTVTTAAGTSATGQQSKFDYIFIVPRLSPTTPKPANVARRSIGDADRLSLSPPLERQSS